ncbi:MAG: hypothetical protein AB7I42_26430 [Bradyrhizobium sp.]|uniref:hypothetical protein n=1 Tax=Bradyrhizobium sp. TaxID=376 RepID=UPI003D0F384A
MSEQRPTDVDLEDLLTIDEVLEKWPGKFTDNMLRTAIARDELGYVRVGRHKKLTKTLLNDYLSRRLVKPCQAKGVEHPSSNSAGIGSTESPESPQSIDTGMSPELRELAAEALIQRRLNKPSSSSPSSSPGTQRPIRKLPKAS